MKRKRLWMRAVNRTYLYSFLGFGKGQHIPPNHFERREHIPMRDIDGNIMFYTTVYIYESNRSKHRVYVQCPICRSYYPFGRLHQHINTAACDTEWMINVYDHLNIFDQMNMNLLMVPDMIAQVIEEHA